MKDYEYEFNMCKKYLRNGDKNILKLNMFNLKKINK